MAFFKALTAIGIGRSELADISNESLIRIEKKLIAEQKLNNSISKNDVEQVLRVLKEYPDVLKEISRYDCFYGILNGYDAEFIDTLARYPAEQAERIKLVVSDYFTDELTEYINLNISQNNWNNVRVLLHYRIFLNNNVIKMLTIRLESKMEYALGVVQQHISHTELKKKLNYIRDQDFYFTLGEVNKIYFLKVIARMVDLIDQNPDYTSKSGFFKEMKRAMSYYDVNNRALANKLGLPPPRQHVTRRPASTPARIAYLAFVVLSILIRGANSCNSTGNTTYQFTGTTSPWSREPGAPAFGQPDSTHEDQRLKMEDFVEARLHPLNYPIASWKTADTTVKKYRNPFQLDIFNSYARAVKNGLPAIGIVNHTDKECIVIAYYRQQYDDQEKKYVPIDNEGSVNIYAFYIPARDSISLDMNMDLLRFYMGKRLAAFNTYRERFFPDSTDLKFSKFTKADSMLFSKAFTPGVRKVKAIKYTRYGSVPVNESPQEYGNTRLRKKITLLTISQPSADSYQLTWTGEAPLYQFTDLLAEIEHALPDSATNKTPLRFELKDSVYSTPGVAVRSFLDH